MKKVLLVIPYQKEIKDVKQTGSKWPRIGLAYVAGYLRDRDVDVRVIDCRAGGIGPTQLKRKIKKYAPDIVGLGPFTEEILDAVEICTMAKKINSKMITVLGGPHASAIPRRTLEEFADIDLVVFGEGEETMLEIVKGIKPKEIPGLAYRKSSKIIINKKRPLQKDLDKFPYPAWDMFPLEKYRGILTLQLREETKGRELELPILSSRGCPFQCNFCYKIYGPSLRDRHPKLVVDEIEHDMKKFGATQFFFVEGTFGAISSHGTEICDEIISRGLHNKIKWVSETRVDASGKLLNKMKEAGCVEVGFGVESGDPKILAKSGKGITIKQVKKTISAAKKIGLRTECYFIMGHPNDTMQTINKTLRFANELDPDIFNIGIMIPYPGTGIRALAEANLGNYRLLCDDWSEYTKQRGGPLEMQNISIDQLRKIQAQAYIKFYRRPHRIFKILRTLPLKKLFKIGVDLARKSLGNAN